MTVVTEVRRRQGLSLSVIALEIVPVALAVTLFSVVGIAHVASRTMVVNRGYELSKLDQRFNELSREHDSLKLELATLRSSGKLEATARLKLGLAPPAAGALLHVPSR
jgi:cell division protein FtsB